MFFRISFHNTFTTLPCAQYRFSTRKPQQQAKGKKKTVSYHTETNKCKIWSGEEMLCWVFKEKKKPKPTKQLLISVPTLPTMLRYLLFTSGEAGGGLG